MSHHFPKIILAGLVSIVYACSDSKQGSFEGSVAKGQESKPSAEVEEVKAATSKPVADSNQQEAKKPPEQSQTKGSFTVYTEPKDPQPAENYRVFVVMQIPEDVDYYNPNDLYIFVKGSDNYVVELKEGYLREGFILNSDLPSQKKTSNLDPSVAPQISVTDKQAVVSVFVQGADAKVKDQIKVTSDLINETQNFEIIF